MNKERLLKIAQFLREKVDDSNFNLDDYTNSPGQFKPDDLFVHNCGTTACAVGFFPHIFPDDWGYAENGALMYYGRLDLGLSSYLDLNLDQYDHLFMPGGANDIMYTNRDESRLGTAQRIEDFVNSDGVIA